MLMINAPNRRHSKLRIPLAALILSALAAGCFGPGYYRPPVYGNPGYSYVPPVYNYRGYGPPVVVEHRTLFGGYAPGRDVWADTVRGRQSYAGPRPEVHAPPAYHPQGGAQVGHGGAQRQ